MSVSGHFIYKDLIVSQNPNSIECFRKLLNNIKPSRLLEIGTFCGGLTTILRDLADEIGISMHIRTYDVNNHAQTLLNSFNNVESIVKNLFNNAYSDFDNSSCRQEVEDFVSQPGTTIVLCDGGCKKCEFNILSEYIKNNDIIMTHDYAPNIEYFEQHMKNITWNWCEIQYSDIDETCKKYNLEPYMDEEFLSVAWSCFVKNTNSVV